MAVLLKERITNGGMRTAGRNRGAASSLLKAQSRPSRQREAAEGRDGSAGLWRRGCGGVAGVTDPLGEGGERRSGQPYGAPRGGTRAAGRAAAGRRAAPVRLLGGAAAAPPPAAAIQRAAAAVPSGYKCHSDTSLLRWERPMMKRPVMFLHSFQKILTASSCLARVWALQRTTEVSPALLVGSSVAVMGLLQSQLDQAGTSCA
eukprot:XP_015146044.1 uncharacterized protein LOC768392 isoform X2 [Gallus gallus]